MISIRQTLIDLLTVLVRRPLALFWALVTGTMASLSGGLLLGTGSAALQRYLLSGMRGEKAGPFPWANTFTITHLSLSLVYMLVSFFILFIFAGMPTVVVLLVNALVFLYFLYVFLVAEPNMPVSQVFQRNLQLIRQGDIWKQVALIFLLVYLQSLAGRLIPEPDVDMGQMANMRVTPEQAQSLLNYFAAIGVLSWVAFVVGSLISASWYRQLTAQPAEPAEKQS